MAIPRSKTKSYYLFRVAMEQDRCCSVSEKKTALSRRGLREDVSLEGDHKSREGHLELTKEW